MPSSAASRVASLAALNEPLRRRIYDHVAESAGPLRRDDVAGALGVARSVATFHLDKLVDAGLLVVEARRPPGRGGPGAGRPAKWYSRSETEVLLSVPDRRYDLAAELLAAAVERSADGSVAVADALRDAARERGRLIGATVSETSGGPIADRVEATLVEHGYEPCRSGRSVTMRNCPFHALADRHRSLVCGMNLELLSGLAEGAGLPPGSARLDPAPDRCCVTLAT